MAERAKPNRVTSLARASSGRGPVKPSSARWCVSILRKPPQYWVAFSAVTSNGYNGQDLNSKAVKRRQRTPAHRRNRCPIEGSSCPALAISSSPLLSPFFRFACPRK
jgi:hypothetical protein